MDNKKHILIVEDAPDIRKIMEYALQSEQYELTVVSNGFDAIEKLKTIIPDLILLDIFMPGISGLEVLKIIKENPATRHIGVILCTGEQDKNHVESAIKLGASGYFTKPFDMNSLADRVAKYFSTT